MLKINMKRWRRSYCGGIFESYTVPTDYGMFIHSLIHSSIHLFLWEGEVGVIHLFIHSFIHSFYFWGEGEVGVVDNHYDKFSSSNIWYKDAYLGLHIVPIHLLSVTYTLHTPIDQPITHVPRVMHAHSLTYHTHKNTHRPTCTPTYKVHGQLFIFLWRSALYVWTSCSYIPQAYNLSRNYVIKLGSR